MSNTVTKPKPLPGLDSAPGIFCEGFQGVRWNNNLLHINLTSLRFDPATEETNNVAAAVLTIPLEVLPNIIQTLIDINARIKLQAETPQLAPQNVILN